MGIAQVRGGEPIRAAITAIHLTDAQIIHALAVTVTGCRIRHPAGTCLIDLLELLKRPGPLTALDLVLLRSLTTKYTKYTKNTEGR